jgi:hypothetical protein
VQNVVNDFYELCQVSVESKQNEMTGLGQSGVRGGGRGSVVQNEREREFAKSCGEDFDFTRKTKISRGW